MRTEQELIDEVEQLLQQNAYEQTTQLCNRFLKLGGTSLAFKIKVLRYKGDAYFKLGSDEPHYTRHAGSAVIAYDQAINLLRRVDGALGYKALLFSSKADVYLLFHDYNNAGICYSEACAILAEQDVKRCDTDALKDYCKVLVKKIELSKKLNRHKDAVSFSEELILLADHFYTVNQYDKVIIVLRTMFNAQEVCTIVGDEIIPDLLQKEVNTYSLTELKQYCIILAIHVAIFKRMNNAKAATTFYKKLFQIANDCYRLSQYEKVVVIIDSIMQLQKSLNITLDRVIVELPQEEIEFKNVKQLEAYCSILIVNFDVLKSIYKNEEADVLYKRLIAWSTYYYNLGQYEMVKVTTINLFYLHRRFKMDYNISILELIPNLAKSFINLGAVKDGLNYYKKLLDSPDFNKAAKYLILLEIGHFHVMLGDYREAIRCYHKIINETYAEPVLPENYALRAQAFIYIGRAMQLNIPGKRGAADADCRFREAVNLAKKLIANKKYDVAEKNYSLLLEVMDQKTNKELYDEIKQLKQELQSIMFGTRSSDEDLSVPSSSPLIRSLATASPATSDGSDETPLKQRRLIGSSGSVDSPLTLIKQIIQQRKRRLADQKRSHPVGPGALGEENCEADSESVAADKENFGYR